jgi:putative endopeptidase
VSLSKKSLVLMCVGAMGVLNSGAMAVESAPSSEIPARREFPLSEKHSPCENFHDYVCSKVEASFKLRDDRSRHTFAFNDSAERLLLEKRKFFKNIKKEKKLSERGEALKSNYLACMDERGGAKAEQNWLKNFVTEVNSFKSIEDFAVKQVQNLQAGRPSLLGVEEAENSENPKIYDLYVATNLMNLPDHSYYENEELIKSYKDLIAAFFMEIDKTIKPDVAQQKAERLVAFEKEFIKTYPRAEVRRQRWTEKRDMAQSDFQKAYGAVNLSSVFQQVPASTRVRLLIPESMQFYVQNLVPEKLELWRDYVLYRFAYRQMDDAYPKFFKKVFDFNHKFFGGPEKRPVRDERCTMAVMGTFAKELDEILLPRLFPNFPEEKFRTVVEKVRGAIVQGVEKNGWLSAEAKKEAKEKMAKARLQLIKPMNEREWDFLPKAKYSSSDRLHNEEALGAALYQKLLGLLKEPVNSDRWYMGPLQINAYYDPTANKFVMPLGILQFPFFDAKGAEIENLGSVGAVVGHELGHGIDDQGSRFDQQGRLRQWMTMKDLAEFSKRGNRLVEQYAKIGHNGKLTLGENVADLVGVTFGYNAAFPDGQGSIEDKQKFFVSYARLWCSVVRPAYAEKQLKTDPHSLGWARINEPLKHQKGFQEAFQCKAGDKMYLPESERVSIW